MAVSRRVPQARVHKATGHARVRIDGKEYWLGRAGTEEAERRYRALIARWAMRQADIVQPEPDPPATPSHATIASTLAAYLSGIKGNATPAQLRTNGKWWLARSVAVSLERYGAVRLRDFGPKLFKQWVEGIASDPMPHKRGGQAVTRTTSHVRKMVAELLRLFAWAVSEELIGADALTALRCVKDLPLDGAREPVIRDPVPDADLAAAVALLPPVYAAACTVSAVSGARITEVLRMRAEDIDASSTPGVWVWRPKLHKTMRFGRERTIVLGARCIAAVSPWLPADGQGPVFAADDALTTKPAGTIPMRRRRKATATIDAADLRRAVRIACRQAGVEPWTPAQLRHNGLTAFRKVGGVDAAQLQGGHASATTTERYAKADVSAAVAAARLVG